MFITDEVLEEIVAAPVKKTENTTRGIRCSDHTTPSIRKSWYYFAKKLRSLGRHSSLADQSQGGVFFFPHAGFLLGLFLDSEDGGGIFPPECQLTSIGLHSIISQEVYLF
jgi:hypothetical protein